MIEGKNGTLPAIAIARRAAELFDQQRRAGFRHTDRLFAGLLPLQWAFAIIIALVVSPTAWAGAAPSIHVHVWGALLLGGVIAGLPVVLALARPGETGTRHVIAAAQMLIGALLIHLMGGRLEAHFHVFGSLAFLALYRDWRVLVTASAIVALDHFFRGIFWPYSIYGIATVSPWRWVEHSGWVVFEDVVLIFGGLRSIRQLGQLAQRQAEGEAVRTIIEREVTERTVELELANAALQGEVAERVRTEEALRRAKDAAEAATRVKGEFLANMSHEIRTPMNGILGITHLVLKTELTPRQREYLGLVNASAESLLTVINDILDFSKIEASKLQVDLVPFALRKVLEETTRMLALRAHAKGLELACRVGTDVPDQAVGDADRLRQVLVNLVGNAIKFTDSGEVIVAVEADNSNDETLGLNVTISDTGIGIPPAKLEIIFEPFEQADGSTTRRFGGTGLGLAISKRLIELMGGRIWVESEPGRGSTFHFTARLGRSSGEAVSVSRPVSQPMTAGSVLVVDDNSTNRLILREILTTWGIGVVDVASGTDALEAARAAAGRSEPFVAALIDGMMPGMDGLGLAQRIRAEPAIAGVPILLLASASQLEDSDLYRSLNISASLLKPVRQSELFDALARVFHSADEVSGDQILPELLNQSFAGSPEATGLRALLAKDQPINQKVARCMLEDLGDSVVDRTKALSHVGEDENIPAKVVAMFRRDTPQRPVECSIVL